MYISRDFSPENKAIPRKRTFSTEFFCHQHFTFGTIALLYTENCSQFSSDFSDYGSVAEYHFSRTLFYFFRQKNEMVSNIDWRLDFMCRIRKHFFCGNSRYSINLWRKWLENSYARRSAGFICGAFYFRNNHRQLLLRRKKFGLRYSEKDHKISTIYCFFGSFNPKFNERSGSISN